MKLLIEKVNKDRDKFNYILRKISLIINQKNHINWKEFYNLLCLLYTLCSIEAWKKTNFFFMEVQIFFYLYLSLFIIIMKILMILKKNYRKLFDLSTYLIMDFEYSLKSNFFLYF